MALFQEIPSIWKGHFFSGLFRFFLNDSIAGVWAAMLLRASNVLTVAEVGSFQKHRYRLKLKIAMQIWWLKNKIMSKVTFGFTTRHKRALIIN